jgi:predicted Zn-dependent protease
MNPSRIRQLKEMLAEDPSDSFCSYALALEYAGDPSTRKLAIAELERLKKNDPDYLALYYQLGLLYHQQEENQMAKQILNEGMLLAKKQGNSHTYAELKFLLEDIE